MLSDNSSINSLVEQYKQVTELTEFLALKVELMNKTVQEEKKKRKNSDECIKTMEIQINEMSNLIKVLKDAEEKLGATFGDRMGKLENQVETNTKAIKDLQGLDVHTLNKRVSNLEEQMRLHTPPGPVIVPDDISSNTASIDGQLSVLSKNQDDILARIEVIEAYCKNTRPQTLPNVILKRKINVPQQEGRSDSDAEQEHDHSHSFSSPDMMTQALDNTPVSSLQSRPRSTSTESGYRSRAESILSEGRDNPESPVFIPKRKLPFPTPDKKSDLLSSLPKS